MTRPTITTSEACTNADLNAIIGDVPTSGLLLATFMDYVGAPLGKVYTGSASVPTYPNSQLFMHVNPAISRYVGLKFEASHNAGAFEWDILVTLANGEAVGGDANSWTSPTARGVHQLTLDLEDIGAGASFNFSEDVVGLVLKFYFRFWVSGGGSTASLWNPRWFHGMAATDTYLW